MWKNKIYYLLKDSLTHSLETKYVGNYQLWALHKNSIREFNE